MAAHKTSSGSDFEDVPRFAQAAKSDGFKNWNSKPQSRSLIQTDFHPAQEDPTEPSNVETTEKKSLAHNSFLLMPNRRADENVSIDSVVDVKNDLLESLSYNKSPSGN